MIDLLGCGDAVPESPSTHSCRAVKKITCNSCTLLAFPIFSFKKKRNDAKTVGFFTVIKPFAQEIIPQKISERNVS